MFFGTDRSLYPIAVLLTILHPDEAGFLAFPALQRPYPAPASFWMLCTGQYRLHCVAFGGFVAWRVRSMEVLAVVDTAAQWTVQFVDATKPQSRPAFS